MENEHITIMENKQRHGCVTAWLILMIILNSFTALMYLLFGNTIVQNLASDASVSMIMLLGLFGVGNVIFAILLLNWKKVGFYGFVATSLIVFIINISIGLRIGQSLFGLVGIAILYGVLQIKGGDRPAWNNLV